MSEASSAYSIPSRAARRDAALQQQDDPARAFANGLILALPLWGLIGLAIWALV